MLDFHLLLNISLVLFKIGFRMPYFTVEILDEFFCFYIFNSVLNRKRLECSIFSAIYALSFRIDENF